MPPSINRRSTKVDAKPMPSPPPARIARRDGLVAIFLLCVFTLLTYSPLWSCDFVNFDDEQYILDNDHVQSGLTAASFRWAWTTTVAANWHPLTWLSLMLDVQLYGVSARGFHFTNLGFHLANTLLLFASLRWLTGAAWRSFFVAALFAVHPLHVESVAWISERKDVLSTFFGLLALGAYVGYARSPSRLRYVLVALAMALSLLAKPMLVTLPFLLLLLDYWPLERWCPEEKRLGTFLPFWRLLMEKLPLLAMSAASCIVTVWAQQRGEAVASLGGLPLSIRLSNALISYAQYLRQTISPLALSVLYPYPRTSPAVGEVMAAIATLAGLTMLAWWGRRRFAYLPVGWLWYVGTLVPVIGLVQVGSQSRADRYTYIPLIGVFVLAVWALADLGRRWGHPRLLAWLGGFVLSYFMLLSWTQVHYWHDSVILWAHTLELDSDNYFAYCNLGQAMYIKGDLDTAGQLFQEAVRRRPDKPLGHNNLARVLFARSEWAAAAHQFRETLRILPESPELYRYLGFTLMMQGKWSEAADSCRRAIALEPEKPAYHHSLAYVLHHLGQTVAARAEYAESLRLDPGWPEQYLQTAWRQATDPDPQQRRGDLAVINAEKAQQAIGEKDAHVFDVLAAAYAEAGRFPEAVDAAEKTLARARGDGQGPLSDAITNRLHLYQQGRTFRADNPFSQLK